MAEKVTSQSLAILFFIVLVYQSLVASVALMAFAKWKKHKPVVLLSVMFLLTALVFTGFFSSALGWQFTTRLLILLLPGALFCLVPLGYLYMYFQSTPGNSFQLKHLIHFIPALVVVFLNLLLAALGSEKYYFSYIPAVGEGLIGVARLPAFVRHPVQVSFLLQLGFYIYLAWKTFPARDESNAGRWVRYWGKSCQAGFALYFLVFNVLVLGNMIYPDPSGLGSTLPYSIAMVLITLWLGICGFKHEAIAQQQASIRQDKPDMVPTSPAADENHQPDSHHVPHVHSVTDPNHSSHSHIAPVLRNRISEGLKQLESEGFFFQPDMTLELVAKKLGTNSRYVSQVVNEETGDSFITYVNMLRIEESKKRLVENINGKYSIEGIGKSVGFKSKSTFNTAFRKHTGMTPSEYLDHLSKTPQS